MRRCHDAASLACVRTATLVDRCAGRCWAHARPELLGTRAVDQLALTQFNGAEAMV
jgi:hypothetical protein